MRMEPLMETLQKSDGDEMHLEPGERVYVLKQGQRSPVGREPVSPGALLQMATQSLKPFQLSELDRKPHTIEREHGNETFQVEFTRPNGSIVVTIRRNRSRVPPMTTSATPPPPLPLSCRLWLHLSHRLHLSRRLRWSRRRCRLHFPWPLP